MVKTYAGVFGPNGPEVTVTDDAGERALDIRHDVRHHAPTFEWGHREPSANQLALAILLDLLGDDEQRALNAYRAFKNLVVSRLDEVWTLTESDVRSMLQEIEVASDAWLNADSRGVPVR